jgi:hypothetical protein
MDMRLTRHATIARAAERDEMSVENSVVEGVTKPASDQPHDTFVGYATNPD